MTTSSLVRHNLHHLSFTNSGGTFPSRGPPDAPMHTRHAPELTCRWITPPQPPPNSFTPCKALADACTPLSLRSCLVELSSRRFQQNGGLAAQDSNPEGSVHSSPQSANSQKQNNFTAVISQKSVEIDSTALQLRTRIAQLFCCGIIGFQSHEEACWGICSASE